MTASDHLRIKDQAAGRTVAAARSIGSAYSKTVDSGAVKGWYIVWCGETRCEHTLKRILEPDDFAGKWLKVNRAFETLSRFADALVVRHCSAPVVTRVETGRPSDILIRSHTAKAASSLLGISSTGLELVSPNAAVSPGETAMLWASTVRSG